MSDEKCETMCEERKRSDLESLETRTEETLQNIIKAKERLASLRNGLRNAEVSQKEKEAIPEMAPKNRISNIENNINKIDNVGHEFNKLISELEDIIK